MRFAFPSVLWLTGNVSLLFEYNQSQTALVARLCFKNAPSQHAMLWFMAMLLDLKGTFHSVLRRPAIFAFVKALPRYKWRRTQWNHFQFPGPTFKTEDRIQNAWGLGYLICSISLSSAREIAWFWCADVGNYTQIILKMKKMRNAACGDEKKNIAIEKPSSIMAEALKQSVRTNVSHQRLTFDGCIHSILWVSYRITFLRYSC